MILKTRLLLMLMRWQEGRWKELKKYGLEEREKTVDISTVSITEDVEEGNRVGGNFRLKMAGNIVSMDHTEKGEVARRDAEFIS